MSTSDVDVQRYQESARRIAESPRGEPGTLAHLLRLICHTQLDNHGTAIKIAKDLLQQYAENPLIYYLLAMNLANDNEFVGGHRSSRTRYWHCADVCGFVCLTGQLKA